MTAPALLASAPAPACHRQAEDPGRPAILHLNARLAPFGLAVRHRVHGWKLEHLAPVTAHLCRQQLRPLASRDLERLLHAANPVAIARQLV